MNYEELVESIRHTSELSDQWRALLFLYLSQLALESGRADLAEKYVAEARDYLGDDISDDEGCPSRRKICCLLKEVEGMLLEAKGRYVEAAESYKEALQKVPEDEGSRKIRLTIRLSHAFIKAGDYQQAQEVSEEAFTMAASSGSRADVAEALYLQGVAIKKDYPEVAKGCFRLCLHLLNEIPQNFRGKTELMRSAQEELDLLTHKVTHKERSSP